MWDLFHRWASVLSKTPQRSSMISILRWIFYNTAWFIGNSPLKRSRQWSKCIGHTVDWFVIVILYFTAHLALVWYQLISFPIFLGNLSGGISMCFIFNLKPHLLMINFSITFPFHVKSDTILDQSWLILIPMSNMFFSFLLLLGI